VDLCKLNASRTRRRKPPLLPYSITMLKLSKARERVGTSNAVDSRIARQHLVRGHFKVRKSGIYWWHHFVRGIGDIPPPRKTYVVR
jgi:hypothetical protein